MQLLKIIGTINFTLLLASLLWNTTKGTIGGQGGFSRAISTIVMLMIGFNLATLIPAPENTPDAYAMCSVVVEGEWWDCGGWPIFVKDTAEYIDKMSAVMSVGGQIPAAIAAFLGSWYIHVRLLKGLTFDHRDIAKAFAGGFLIYASLAFMPAISNYFNEIVKDLVSIVSNSHQGDAALRGWLETIKAYKEYAKQDASSINVGIWVLRAFIVIPLTIFNFLNFTMIIFRNILMALIPLSVFLATLRRDSDPTTAISLLGNYAMLSAMQAIQWLLLSGLPLVEAPTNIANFDVMAVLSSAVRSLVMMAFVGIFLIKITMRTVVLPTMDKLLSPRVVS